MVTSDSLCELLERAQAGDRPAFERLSERFRERLRRQVDARLGKQVRGAVDVDDVSVLLGNGDGTFQEQKRLGAGDGPTSIVAVDVNGDGRIDLGSANAFSDDISVLAGKGDETFLGQQRFGAGASPHLQRSRPG